MAGGTPIRAVVAALLAFFAALCAGAASAAPPCTTHDHPAAPLTTLPADTAWTCGEPGPARPGQTVTLCFDVDPAQPAPRYLVMRLGRFEAAAIAVVDGAGRYATARVPMAAAIPTSDGPTIALPLPAITGAPEHVLVRFDGMAHTASLESLHLAAERPDRAPGHIAHLLMIALLIGMLAMPIVFDGLFWRVLRDRFIAWHAAMTACFILLIVFRSGIANEVVALDIALWRYAIIGTFGTAIAACLMFTRHFIEADKRDPRLDRAMAWAVPWVLLVSAVQAVWPEGLLAGGLPLHALALSPVLALWLVANGKALARGSRAAVFQLVGWIPLTAALAIQLVSELLPGVPAVEALELFYLGMLCEAMITALGVADRFLTLRRERDSARKMALELGSLVERDPLTDLINRRGLERRFPQLQAQGFATFALLDLDRFKDINDTFGHGVGDDVLRSVAAALSGEGGRNSIAVRMGGEEFLILLRGDDQAGRAERMRRAISLRVAREIAEIDRLVTASMGVIESPQGLADTLGFDELYARADKLLYEAKESGRNRTMHERLTLFPSHGARGPRAVA
ncbi:diguanylate cyclase domain-containing protein [Pelagerythrobacter sp.]|uniref:GGDEF domain-containing protein n=1 Tax=Pelagerythrobacter sp. TaxID=2800702 RepID=UPI0035B1EE34